MSGVDREMGRRTSVRGPERSLLYRWVCMRDARERMHPVSSYRMHWSSIYLTWTQAGADLSDLNGGGGGG